MKRLGAVLAVLLVVMAVGSIWFSGTGARTDSTSDGVEQTDAAYDYDARDVVVQQMGPDGVLQYEVRARQITQLRTGHVEAKELVMYHDPAGSQPGGPNRWTLTGDRADLPDSGLEITVQGNVRGEGRPPQSRAMLTLTTEQLTYDLRSRELFTPGSVDVNFGNSRLRCGDLRLNMETGELGAESDCNGTF